MDNFEAQWAVALKKSQQKTTVTQKNTLPLNTLEEQIQEEMDYFKKKLLDNIEKKEKTEAQKTLKKLYNIRARKLNLDIKKLEENYGTALKTFVEDLIKKYYYDCYNLTMIVNQSLK